MKKLFYAGIVFISFLLVSLFFSVTVTFADTNIPAEISTNLTLDLVNSPYVVRGGMVIYEGATLSVDPGVEIKFANDDSGAKGSMTVLGSLNVNGTENLPVYFSSNTENDDWNIYFSHGTSTLSHMNLKGSNQAIFANGENLQIDHLVADDLKGTAIILNNSLANISSSDFGDGNEALTLFNQSNVTVSDSLFHGISVKSNDAAIVVRDNSSLQLQNVTIKNIIAGDAVSVYSNADMTMSSSTLSAGAGNGILAYNKGVVSLNNSTIENFTSDAILAYSNAQVSLDHSLLTKNDVGLEIYTPIVFHASLSDIYGNKIQGIKNFSSGIIDASNIWWGSPIGPHKINEILDSNATDISNDVVETIGEGVGENVSFDPWLTEDPLIPAMPKCCSNVAFIPGLEGSRLYTNGLFSENQLWEPNRNADVDELDMDISGKSIRNDVYTRDVVDKVGINIGLFDWTSSIYDGFIKYMDGLVADKKINNWEALPYDWRLDLDDVAGSGLIDAKNNISYLSSTTPDVSYMISQIQFLANHSQTGKVTLVTHSNGGLVAKVLIQKLQTLKDQNQNNLIDKIDKVIMVAAPQLGAVDALGAILHGYKLNYVGGLVLNENHARAMAENMPGVYNLLPSQKYFENNVNPVIIFATSTDTFSNFSKYYGRTITTYDSLEKFLTGMDGRKDPSFGDTINPNVLNKNLLNKAENQHTAIDNWQFPPTLDLTQVAGVGVDTLSGLRYVKGAVCNTDIMMCDDALDLEPVFSNDGDGTVMSSSAILGGPKKLYFDLKNYNDIQSSFGSKDTINHSDILEAWPVQNMIGGLIENGTDSFPFITQDKPQIESKQLLVVAHSPIDLNAYDSKGNHTGLIDNPDPNSDIQIVEQKIPNSTYVKFGEGKYLSLDISTTASANVSFQGTDYGSFTIDTSLIKNGTVMASSTFVDIPVTPELKGSIINTTSSPILVLDIDGDGVVDATTTVNKSFDPILYIEIMKKTIDSFNLKKAPEKSLLQKLDQVENKIKTGKIKNADKQIQKLAKNIGRTNKKLRKITDDERNQLIVMLTNLVDNLK